MKRTYMILLFVILGIVLTCLTVRAFCMAGETPVKPENGVGRVETISNTPNALTCVETHVETSVDTPETEMPEIEPYIASETVVETETEFVEDTYVPDTEEYVEVVPEADPIIETDIDALIVQVAGEYVLPWQLVRAVCYVESGFNPNAISSTGDYGLMQVSYINHGWLGLDNPLDPEQNIRAGCKILKDAIDASDGDFTRALMRYNRGDAYAMSQWNQGIFSTAYTEKVLGKYYEYLIGGY